MARQAAPLRSMRPFSLAAAPLLAALLLLAGCGKEGTKGGAETPPPSPSQTGGEAAAPRPGAEETSATPAEDGAEAFVQAYQDLVAGVKGESPDHAALLESYRARLQPLVRKIDAARNETIDNAVVAALEGARNGQLPAPVAAQVVDKLGQKAFFLAIREAFKEAQDHLGDPSAAKAEVEEAKAFYQGVLKGTVEKRDAAYGTQLAAAIEGAFDQIDGAVSEKSSLDFALARQVVDKSLMKAFYLAVGALPHGYASKVESQAQSDPEKARVQQAEGWAFYQSLHGYLAESAKESADAIQRMLDLGTPVTEVRAAAINDAFVRGFSAVALHEYEESFESWGQERAVITALEGALFIDLIEGDLRTRLGDTGFQTLRDQAQQLLEAVRAGDRAQADALHAAIEMVLAPLAGRG